MKRRFGMPDRVADVITFLAILALIGMAIWVLLLTHETNSRGQTNSQKISSIQTGTSSQNRELAALQSETAALDQGDETLSQIFNAAAVEEANQLAITKAICAATPGCVLPPLLPVPAITPTKGSQ